MRKNIVGVIQATVLCSGLTGLQATAQPAAPSLMNGAFSEAQAIRGQDLYYDNCLQCHGEGMEGVDQAPPLAGPQFAGNWKGSSLTALVDRMTTMPPDKPGKLGFEENVDLLTYILWFNELPLGGADLAADREVLSGIIFETPATQF